MSIHQLSNQGFELFLQTLQDHNLQTKVIEEGQYILKQGQTITELYWVELGEFGLEYSAPNGRTYSLGLNLVDKHLFGEDEFLTESLCQFSVCAYATVEVKVIPVALMTELLKQHPSVAVWLSCYLSRRYQNGMYDAMNRFLYPLMYNVALDVYERYLGLKPEVSFDQVYKEAARFGCSERVYRRVVNQLIDKGLLSRDGAVLSMVDVETMKQFIDSNE